MNEEPGVKKKFKRQKKIFRQKGELSKNREFLNLKKLKNLKILRISSLFQCLNLFHYKIKKNRNNFKELYHSKKKKESGHYYDYEIKLCFEQTF
jgi:hypothetical protein